MEERIEERVSRRGLILGILVICAVLGLAIWGGSLIGTSRAKQQQKETQTQLTSARTELSQMQSSYTSLQRDNVALRTQLISTESTSSQMQSSYVGLQQDNVALRTQLISTESTLSQMRQDNAKLQAQLTSLTSDYNSLKMRYEALEKTKQFVIDSKLRVSLSTEQQFAAATWVRGEVTNVGSSTVPKIYALVSRYKSDGSLDRLDLPPAIVVNLAPGGAGHFSFVATGETCKVTLLGDY